MKLVASITDLDGARKARLDQFTDLEADLPLNDSHTGKVTLSMYDKAVKEVIPLKRLLKIVYGETLLFWGYMGKPTYDYDAGTVVINAHDPTIRLKHHYHRYGDYVVDQIYPIDGRGVRWLIESSIPIESQLDRGIPGNGILFGEDTTTHQATKAAGGIWRQAERGANVWETITSLSQIVGAPDFRFRPVDQEHPAPDGTVWEPGFFCVLETADRMGEDRTDTVKFRKGFGTDNAENVVHEPDGFSVRNYWVSVYPGGERTRDDDERKGLYHSESSWSEYGIMQGWESSGQKDPKNVLVARSRAYVKAYAYPPDFFSVTPGIDKPNVPVFGVDYYVGDNIMARGKKGQCDTGWLEGRVIGAKVKQVDASGNTRVDLECVPTIDAGETEPNEVG